MPHRHRILGAAALAVAAFLITACQRAKPPATAPGPRPGGTITVALPGEPPSLNAMIVGGERMVTRVVVGQMRWGLLAVRDDYTYEPRLAESVPSLDNGLVKERPFTVTFKLRKDAVWSDGRPITAEDVIFTWRTIMSKKTRTLWRHGYDLIQRIDAPDPKTVVIRFKEPFAGYLDLFSAPAYGYVLPKHLLAGEDFNSVETSGALASSGPFVLERWDRGSDIVLARNPRFWGKAPWVERLVFKFGADEHAAQRLFAAGGADVYAPEMEGGVLAREVIDGLAALPGVTVATTPSAAYEQITLNVATGSLAPPANRRALMAALDRSEIASAALGPYGKVAEGIVPRIWNTARPEGGYWGAGPAPGRLAKSVRVSVDAPIAPERANDAARSRELAVIVRQLEAAGFVTGGRVLAASDLFAKRLPQKRYEAATWASVWQPSPNFAFSFFFDFSGEPGLGQNYSGYASRVADRLVTELESEPDPDRRASLTDGLERTLARDLPVIPLFHRATVVAARRQIHPLPPNPTIEGPFGDMSRWWVGN